MKKPKDQSADEYSCTACGCVVPVELSLGNGYVPETHVCSECGRRGTCTKGEVGLLGEFFFHIVVSVGLVILFTLLSQFLPSW